MPVNRIEFANIRSLEDFYRQLAAQTALPAHFGHNLDALFDVLTTEIAGPMIIVWHHHDASAPFLGHEHYTALLSVLHDAANRRPDIQLFLD
ncbi:MAG: barstar family protein [Formivibrio sp.]|nr:barstar family protein [Formivibrio sp.]